MKAKKSVSLVLGSGGARGYTHIGVIRELEKQGYEIKSISGSSMGALIGGLYAAGKLKDYEDWVKKFNVIDILKLVDFSFKRGGMIKADKVFSKIEELVGDVKIENLNIEFTATATDIFNKKEVWLQKGSLRDAIRASISIPTVFTPKKLNGRVLFDGGILNPLPILPTVSQFSDLVIAVNLNSDVKVKEKYKRVLEKKKGFIEDNIQKFFNKSISKQDDLTYFKLINKSIETMQEVISRHQLASHRPDIMIDIPIDICDFYDFHKAKELIFYGKKITRDILNEQNT